MAKAQIVNVGVGVSATLQDVAPTNWWQQLSAALAAADFPSPRTIYLNWAGERAVYGADQVASLVGQGAIWVDWCGWPWFIYPGTGGAFDDLVGRLKIPMQPAPGLNPLAQHPAGNPWGFSPYNYNWFRLLAGYPYSRGLCTSTDLQAAGLATPLNTPATPVGQVQVAQAPPQIGVETVRVYSVFGAQPDLYGVSSSGGGYFYATAAASGLLGGPDGVQPQAYAAFLLGHLGASAAFGPPPAAAPAPAPPGAPTPPSLPAPGQPSSAATTATRPLSSYLPLLGGLLLIGLGLREIR